MSYFYTYLGCTRNRQVTEKKSLMRGKRKPAILSAKHNPLWLCFHAKSVRYGYHHYAQRSPADHDQGRPAQEQSRHAHQTRSVRGVRLYDAFGPHEKFSTSMMSLSV